MDAPLPHPFPVALDLRGVDVLVVGGGRIAARKARSLLDAGAVVTAVAPRFDEEFPAEATRITRSYEADDIRGRMLVISATDDDSGARASVDAAAAGTWVNVADDPERCTCHLPAVLRHGPVTVAVSTGGASPALAGWIRDRIADVIGPEVGVVAESLATTRAAMHARGESTEAIDWRPIIEAALAQALGEASTAQRM